MLTYNPQCLDNSTPHAKRARYDYIHEGHTIEEIQNDYYFGWRPEPFKRGDFIDVVDARNDHYRLHVDDVFPAEKRVVLSIVEKYKLTPVTRRNSMDADAGLAVRFKGARGGKWCVMDNTGTAVEKGYETKGEAERRLANMLEANQKAV